MSRTPRPCSKCPKRDKNGVCLIRGQLVVPNHPSCAYGRKLMNMGYCPAFSTEEYVPPDAPKPSPYKQPWLL